MDIMRNGSRPSRPAAAARVTGQVRTRPVLQRPAPGGGERTRLRSPGWARPTAYSTSASELFWPGAGSRIPENAKICLSAATLDKPRRFRIAPG